MPHCQDLGAPDAQQVPVCSCVTVLSKYNPPCISGCPSKASDSLTRELKSQQNTERKQKPTKSDLKLLLCRGGWRGEGGAGAQSGEDMMDVEMEADEEAGPPEAKVKAEPSELPVTRQRAVGGGESPKHEALMSMACPNPMGFSPLA